MLIDGRNTKSCQTPAGRAVGKAITTEVTIEAGVVSHPSGKRATFGEFAARAEQLPVPDNVRPKERADYKLIGRALPRARPDGTEQRRMPDG